MYLFAVSPQPMVQLLPAHFKFLKESIMRSEITRVSLLLAALFAAFAPCASAAMPNGVMAFEFTGENIYDFSQFRDCNVQMFKKKSLTLCMDVDMVPNGRGKHSGTASFEFSGAVEGTLVGPAQGSVSGTTGGKGKARIKVATSGKLMIPGSGNKKTSIGVKCEGKTGVSGYHKTQCKVQVVIKGVGESIGKAKYEGQLNGGDWSLAINVSPVNAKKFAGIGTDTLGYQYKVAGKYDAAEDTSEVEVTGKGQGKGAWVILKHLNGAGEAKAKFKVQGYKGSAMVQATPL
jgi:hypothetical protein